MLITAELRKQLLAGRLYLWRATKSARHCYAPNCVGPFLLPATACFQNSCGGCPACAVTHLGSLIRAILADSSYLRSPPIMSAPLAHRAVTARARPRFPGRYGLARSTGEWLGQSGCKRPGPSNHLLNHSPTCSRGIQWITARTRRRLLPLTPSFPYSCIERL